MSLDLQNIPLTAEEKEVVAQNISADVADLALQLKPSKNVRTEVVLRQIDGIQHMKDKCPMWVEKEDIVYPRKLSLEQSSSQDTAEYKSNLCKGESLVDLTGGMGIDFSFMSRGFKRATYVEMNEELCAISAHNFKVLGLDNVDTVCGNAEAYLDKIEGKVSCIMIDPARRDGVGRKTVKISDCTPDLVEIHDKLLSKADMVIAKLSPMLDISQALSEMKSVSEIHILSVGGECKELLLVMKSGVSVPQQQLPIHTINILKDGSREELTFTPAEEKGAFSKFAITPRLYLYEPNASILKAGAFRTISTRYEELYKLHVNTHLYTSDEEIMDFPGRKFEVCSWSTLAPGDIQILLRNVKKANLSVRNFPMTVEKLRRKLNIKEGGDIYLFAVTLSDGKKVILRCKKM
ncbi:MAG: class I SAM-dependent methyltransferase [Bacteroidales bacterium]|nr:class I SAM-dependent methyltransferase [Bacteroidales bacterium]